MIRGPLAFDAASFIAIPPARVPAAADLPASAAFAAAPCGAFARDPAPFALRRELERAFPELLTLAFAELLGLDFWFRAVLLDFAISLPFRIPAESKFAYPAGQRVNDCGSREMERRPNHLRAKTAVRNRKQRRRAALLRIHALMHRPTVRRTALQKIGTSRARIRRQAQRSRRRAAAARQRVERSGAEARHQPASARERG